MTDFEGEIKKTLLRQAGDEFKANSAFSDATLLKLDAFFGEKVLNGALELLDKHGKDVVTQLEFGSRSIWVVKGASKGSTHNVLPKSGFCPCAAFRANKTFNCKHVVVAELATSMNLAVKIKVDSKENFVSKLVDCVIETS